ncbi:hypothetical protein BSZ35_00105 [Salinibacter sp. 10B]|uniref:YegP family protein n=1 Tax=Salinibacter sp. 10B TaxID=1923971 RepID=UPI000CF549B2|nr:YegP family protein [Salinibacter sp. 10B]PQJ36792.1 hypothetical protein BSZ35_00105 [Salinibacter sp. 10B]
MRNTKFRIFEDAANEYRWTFIARNGEEIAVPGESYEELDECLAAVERVQGYAPGAEVEDLTTPSPKEHESDSWFELYQDDEGEYRWRLRAPNSEIIAVASEGYHNRGDARSGIELLQNQGPVAEIIDETEEDGSGGNDEDGDDEDDSNGGFVPPADPSDPDREQFA